MSICSLRDGSHSIKICVKIFLSGENCFSMFSCQKRRQCLFGIWIRRNLCARQSVVEFIWGTCFCRRNSLLKSSSGGNENGFSDRKVWGPRSCTEKGLAVTCQDLGPKDYLMHKTVNLPTVNFIWIRQGMCMFPLNSNCIFPTASVSRYDLEYFYYFASTNY